MCNLTMIFHNCEKYMITNFFVKRFGICLVLIIKKGKKMEKYL